jgi:hypothetical protein
MHAICCPQEDRQRAKELAVEAKLRLKTEAAQEKQRQKAEAEQEKRRQADQANIIKTIKLKFVTGGGSSSSRNLAASGPSSSSLGAPSPLPLPPPSAKMQMAPSNMFFASTGPSSGSVLKKKAPGLGAHKVKQGGFGVVKRMGPGRPPGSGRGVGRPPGGSGRGMGSALSRYDAPMDLLPMTWEPTATQASGGPSGGPADLASLKKILDKIQVKDPHNIFLHPVSDAVVSRSLRGLITVLAIVLPSTRLLLHRHNTSLHGSAGVVLPFVLSYPP